MGASRCVHACTLYVCMLDISCKVTVVHVFNEELSLSIVVILQDSHLIEALYKFLACTCTWPSYTLSLSLSPPPLERCGLFRHQGEEDGPTEG